MRHKIISFVQGLNFLFSYLFQNSFSEIKFLKTIILDNKVVIDVGSNLGSFIKILNNINKKTEIYSIEPNLELINFQKNRFKNKNNIKYFNIAIDSKNGSRKFYIRNPASHSSVFKKHIDEKINTIRETVDVEAVSLENFINEQNIKKITLLKIDIEGLDYEVLFSTKSLLKNNIIEFVKIEANRESIERIMAFAYKENLKFLGISKAFYLKNQFNMMDLYFENKNSIKKSDTQF